MITENLALEKELIVEDMDEVMDLLNSDFLVCRKETDLVDLIIEETRLFVMGDWYPFTDWAFEGLCSLLNLPVQFARSIPFELLVENFNRLKIENNRRVTVLISRNTVINITYPPFLAAKSLDLLNRLKLVQSVKELTQKAIRLSDRGIVINFLSESLVAQPIPGDITELGFNIFNSETGFRGAKASFFLNRLVCSNGAILSNSWGSVEWAYDYRISYERSLSNFLIGIENFNINFDRFSAAYDNLIARNLSAVAFINVWRRLARIVGSKEADRISGIGIDERNQFNHEVREGDRNRLTGILAYDLYNKITENARQSPFMQRSALERLGGSFVDLN